MNLFDQIYKPEYLLIYERGATAHVNEPRIRNMFTDLEIMIEESAKNRIEDKKMEMYRGTTKKWQVLDEQVFSRQEAEKIQSAIQAPSPAELERFKEDSPTIMKLPITNANVSEWRDKKRAIDTVDFNHKLVEFEKKRTESFFMKRYERPKQLAKSHST
jgi:hypothetical protein